MSKGKPTPKRNTARAVRSAQYIAGGQPAGPSANDSPKESLAKFVYHTASVNLEKVQIMQKFAALPELSKDMIVAEVKINYDIAALAMIESLDILNGKIPDRIQKRYSAEDKLRAVRTMLQEGSSPEEILEFIERRDDV